MNKERMKIVDLAEKQGWNWYTLADLLLTWIGQDPNRARSAIEFLQAKADAENEREYDVEVVFRTTATSEAEAIHRVDNQLAILTEGHDHPVIPWTIDERGTAEVETGGRGPSLDDESEPIPPGDLWPCVNLNQHIPTRHHSPADCLVNRAHSEQDTTTGRDHA